MTKFIKYYALEIYTVISMLILLIVGFMGDLSIIQKFVLVYIFLFILHEWEEMKYPGGFADLISNMLKIEINEDIKRATRIPTSILLLNRPYSPGFITAELQLLTSIIFFIYTLKHNMLTLSDVIIGLLIMIVCFVIMQKTITLQVGFKYSDLPKILKKHLDKNDSEV